MEEFICGSWTDLPQSRFIAIYELFFDREPNKGGEIVYRIL
jgi:hypothetical protein